MSSNPMPLSALRDLSRSLSITVRTWWGSALGPPASVRCRLSRDEPPAVPRHGADRRLPDPHHREERQDSRCSAWWTPRATRPSPAYARATCPDRLASTTSSPSRSLSGNRRGSNSVAEQPPFSRSCRTRRRGRLAVVNVLTRPNSSRCLAGRGQRSRLSAKRTVFRIVDSSVRLRMRTGPHKSPAERHVRRRLVAATRVIPSEGVHE
jgi:hypothetical protein